MILEKSDECFVTFDKFEESVVKLDWAQRLRVGDVLSLLAIKSEPKYHVNYIHDFIYD